MLFRSSLESGGAFYLYRDLEGGLATNVTADTVYDRVTATPDGKLLAGVKAEDGKGTVDIFDLEKGEKKGTLSIPFGTPTTAIAFSSDGGKLSLAVGSGEEMILGTVDM